MNSHKSLVIMLLFAVFLGGCTAEQLQQMGPLVQPVVSPAPVESLHLGWVWPEEGPAIWPMATVGADGIIYMADETGMLHAVAAPGNVSWSLESECGQAYPPVLSPDGETLYFVALKDVPQVCAMAVDGTPLWATPVETLAQAVPTVAPDGTLHLRTNTGIARIDASGIITEYSLPEEMSSPLTGSQDPPVVDGHGNAYFPLRFGGKVLVLSPEYEMSAQCDVGLIRSNVLAYGEEGFVVNVEPGEIVAYAPDCSELWRTAAFEEETENTELALATGPNDTIYAGGAGGLLLALANDGQLLWRNDAQAEAANLFYVDVAENGRIAAFGDGPPTLLAFGPQGEPTLAQVLYQTDATGMPVPMPEDGVAQVHLGKLEAYTSDPQLAVELPPPVPPPADKAAAETELMQFMVDMIVADEIEGTLQYIEDTDWYGTGPTANLIVWAGIASEGSAESGAEPESSLEGIPALDESNPRMVWTYGDGELTEVAGGAEEKLAAIEDYRATYMEAETGQSIFAWGFYAFAIVSLDENLQKAEVYRSASCGPLCGSGYLFTLERAPDGTWFVSDSKQLWQM